MKTRLYITVTIIVLLISLLSTPTPYAGNINSDLLTAAMQGDTNQVKALLDKGANVNAKDEDGLTALMYAKEINHTKIIEVLKQYGAKK